MKLGKKVMAVIAVFALSLGIQQAFGQTLTASFTVTPSKNNLCRDSAFTFKSTTTYTGSGTVTYTWDFGDGSAPVSGSTTVNKTYATAGSFSVTLIVASTDAANDTATATVIVYPRPVADYSYTGINCARQEFIFADKSSVSSGSIVAYEWSFPGKKFTTANPVHLFSSPGTFQIKLKITTDKGCTDSVTKTIVIRERPVADFTFTPNCVNADVTFKHSMAAGTFHTVKWDFGDGTTSTQIVPAAKKYSAPGVYNVKLVATNTTTGCQDSVTQQVPVYDKATPKFIFRDFCTTYPDKVYIVHQVDPLFGEVKEIRVWWDNTAGFQRYNLTNGLLKDTLYYKYGTGTNHKVGKYKVNIEVITSYDCISNYSDSIRIMNEPDAGFVLSNACEDVPVTFYDTSKVAATFGGAISKWLWVLGDKTAGSPNVSTQKNPTHTYKEPGTYTVKLYAYNQGDCVDSVEGTVVVGMAPDAAFGFDAKCKQTAVPFTDESYIDELEGDTIVAWHWDFGDGSSPSTQKDPTHAFNTVDTYKVVLKVTTNKGCTDTISQQIVILPDATPDFTVTGNCERSPIIFNEQATAPDGKTIVGYMWAFGDGASDNSNAKVVSHSYINPGDYTASLRVTTSDGCVSDPAYKSIKVIPSPKVDFVTSPSCVNNPVIFTNLTTIDPNETIIQYRWYFGDGTSSFQATKGASHTYNATGLYNVSLAAYTAKGCRDSMVKAVEISPIPKPDFTFKNVCNDSAVSFLDASTIVSGSISARTWKWGDGGVTTGNNDKPSHKYAAPGTYTVTLVITSAAGCKDSIQKTITTFPKPKADFRFTSHCADSAIEFFDQSTMTGGSVYAWKWNFQDGPPSYDQNPTHVYGGEFGGTYDVTLTAYSSLGCTDVITKKVDAYRLPKKNSIYLGGDEICEQTPFTFDESDAQNTGWVWNFGDGSIRTQRTGTYTYGDSGYYNVRLDLVNKNGCRDSFFKTVYVHPLPIVKFGWKGGCVGVDVVFRDSSTIYNKKRRRLITIDFGDGTFPVTMDSLIFRHTYLKAGTFTITYTVTENSDVEPKCGHTIQKQITIYDNPKVGFKADTKCFGEATQFFDTTFGAGEIVSWKWDFGDGTIDVSNNPSPVHAYGAAGNYDVTLSIKTKVGCTGSFTRVVTVLPKPKADFRLIPNPATVLKPEVEFVNVSSNDVISYKWTLGNGEESTDKVPPGKPGKPGKLDYPDTGHYVITLIVKNAAGCSDTLIDTLKVKMDYTIHPPNILTLNGDGVNDEWKPLGEGVENYELVILDRWGQQVFQSTDFNETWKGDYNRNGVLVPEGVYIYQIKIVDFAQEEVRVVKGTITVIQ